MILKIKEVELNGWRYIDDIADLKCYPAKVDNIDMTAAPSQTTMVEIVLGNGESRSIGIETESYLLNDYGDTLSRLHR